MRVQHNIMAMNAYRNYNNNTKALSGNLEKLSSGYKINRAGDDAAGLAISEKMRAQITGLNAAQKNVKDGISLVKTAEGAMQEIQDMLNRMDYLATQSANGTYQDEVDRENLQKEVVALKDEINRIADSANFNGIKLLDGSWAKEVTGGTDEPVTDPSKYDFTSMKMNSMTKATTAAGIAAATYESADGHDPTAATKATFTIKIGGGVTMASLDDLKNIDSGLTDASGATLTIGDLFDITVGEEEYDADKIGTDGVSDHSVKITLTSKVAGKMDAATATIAGALQGFTGFACASNVTGATGTAASYFDLTNAVKVKDGTNLGEESDAGKTNAVYKVTVDLSKVKGGMEFELGGQSIKFDATTSISVAGTVGIMGFDMQKLADGDEDTVKALVKAIETAAGDFDGTGTGGFAFEYESGDIDGSMFTFTLTAGDSIAGTDGNTDKLKVYNDADGAVTVEDTPGTDGPEADAAGNQVQVSYKWTPSSLKAGDVIQIAGKYNIELVDEDDWKAEMANQGKINMKDFKDAIAAGDDTSIATLLNKALMNLDGKAEVQVSAANGSNITLQSRKTFSVKAEDWAKGDGQFAIGKPIPEDPKPEEPEEPADTKGGKALTLQIGDTSDKFNQLGVNIGDMHVNAMGTGKATIDGKEVEVTKTIADIDIGTQEGAQEAIYSIRNAINQVSSVRGDLGAVQNRLEHTQNNLSVMAENIQDAESTIRDTDVAEEMMSYVKNNILVQSAQAMLAQANQVPQGVLQLLG